jgi:hypothetical protein
MFARASVRAAVVRVQRRLTSNPATSTDPKLHDAKGYTGRFAAAFVAGAFAMHLYYGPTDAHRILDMAVEIAQLTANNKELSDSLHQCRLNGSVTGGGPYTMDPDVRAWTIRAASENVTPTHFTSIVYGPPLPDHKVGGVSKGVNAAVHAPAIAHPPAAFLARTCTSFDVALE